MVNPQVVCIPISGSEYVVRAGHLEGYSLIVTDEGDGVARAVLQTRGAVTFTVDDIVDQCGVEAGLVDRHVEELVAAGIVVKLLSGVRDVSPVAWTAFARYGTLPEATALRPIVVFGDALAERLAMELEALEIAATSSPIDDLSDFAQFAWREVEPEESDGFDLGTLSLPPPELPVLVVALADGSVATMQRINADAVAAGAPVLYLQVSGAYTAIGPYVQPGASACYWEFELQRSRSMFDHAHYQAVLRTPESPLPSTYVLSAVAVSAIPWIVELASTSRSSLLGRVLMGRMTTSELQAQTVLRLPRCPICLPTRPLLRNLLI